MRVLFIDDDEKTLKASSKALETDGHVVVGARSRAQAIEEAERSFFDVALLNLQIGEENSVELVPELLDENPRLDIIVLIPADSRDLAVETMRLGALDFVSAPFTQDQLLSRLTRVAKNRRLRDRLSELEMRVNADLPPMIFDTANPVMTSALEVVAKAANSNASILLQGESGTGKSVFARFIHQSSSTPDAPFVTVSCPSLSPQLLASELFGYVRGAFTGAVKDTWGKVEQADGGTLFLDEIGELSLELQPKLLRLLQEREYERVGETQTHKANVRIMAATNIDLDKAVTEGRFREDLLYRLNVITLTMPPLRERWGDLMDFANNYLKFFAQQCRKPLRGFTAAAERAMLQYAWPGNLRELRNYVERAVIMSEGELVSLEDLPGKLTPEPRLQLAGIVPGANVALADLEKEHIRLVTSRCKTREEAARILGIDPTTLYRKRRKLDI